MTTTEPTLDIRLTDNISDALLPLLAFFELLDLVARIVTFLRLCVVELR